MRHLRGWVVWAWLTLCALVMLGAMTYLTISLVESDKERAKEEARADLLDSMRLALWRMDGAALAWITEEAQRQLNSEPQSRIAKLRFEAREDGTFPNNDAANGQLLQQTLGTAEDNVSLYNMMKNGMPSVPDTWNNPPPAEAMQPVEDNKRDSILWQNAANAKELAGRSRVINQTLDVGKKQFEQNINNTWIPGGEQLDKSGQPFTAQIHGELFLLRNLQWRAPNGKYIRAIQGTWIDRDEMKKLILGEVVDLFPNGKLIPADRNAQTSGLALVSFPFWQLDPGPAVIPQEGSSTGLFLPLGLGWSAIAFAMATSFLLVSGIMRLSERRASFVSAVTHELRTPLTTFRLYSDMLESGAVREEKRSDYMRVLSREADRLAHLVENVLAFSRIERGSARTIVRETSLRELLEPLRERLDARLNTAGMELKMDLDGKGGDTRVKVDAASVEHILFNLVDNAAKYASSGFPAEVCIRMMDDSSSPGIYVMDRGPGIPPAKRDRIFQPFHKSARDAAESRPGVGLGLALSRRLARSLGGDLHYESKKNQSGACFLLRLPVT